MDIIVFGSLHGSAKRYAERLSELTGIGAMDYREAKEIGRYDRVIYVGAIYAGGLVGLKKTVGTLSPNQTLFVATVGMLDPKDPENIADLRKALKEQIPPQSFDEKRIFHLRGAIDYGHLGLMHRMLMSMIHSKASKMPEGELDSVSKVVLDTYGKTVDLVDLDSLKPLVEAITLI